MEIAPEGHPREVVQYEIQEDGEFLTLWVEIGDDEKDEFHIITMTREVAIELAREILKEMTFKEEE